MPALTFRNALGHGFKLVQDVVMQLQNYSQLENDNHEAGGVLLGRYILESSDVVVDQITEPTLSDLRSRFGFTRNTEGHQELVSQAWHESEGTCHYLGEWHTHPELKPMPSRVDVTNWKRLLSCYRADSDPLYFVIVGMTTIAVWQGHKRPIKLEPLILDKSEQE